MPHSGTLLLGVPLLPSRTQSVALRVNHYFCEAKEINKTPPALILEEYPCSPTPLEE
jgi:hypothetical protein